MRFLNSVIIEGRVVDVNAICNEMDVVLENASVVKVRFSEEWAEECKAACEKRLAVRILGALRGGRVAADSVRPLDCCEMEDLYDERV